MPAAEAVARLRRSPAATALFLDFDGTLAAIVAAAADARPLPGVRELLGALSRTYGAVAIVSGRPVAFLLEHLPPVVELHGLYGLESAVGGTVAQHPEAARWAPVVDEVARDALASLPPAVAVEHKGLSLTLHYRQAPEAQADAQAWAEAAARRSGLDLRTAKMSRELHPPVAVDKGTVVTLRSAGMSAVAYVGDDVGDLPAFAALDELAALGVDTVKVAVRTPDAADAVLAQADVLVDGPAGAVGFLDQLR